MNPTAINLFARLPNSFQILGELIIRSDFDWNLNDHWTMMTLSDIFLKEPMYWPNQSVFVDVDWHMWHNVNPFNIAEYIVVLFHPKWWLSSRLKNLDSIEWGLYWYKVYQWKAHCHLWQRNLLDLWLPSIVVAKIRQKNGYSLNKTDVDDENLSLFISI